MLSNYLYLIDDLMKDFIDTPYTASGRPNVHWDAAEDKATLSVALPGYTREDVDVSTLDNTITIKGKAKGRFVSDFTLYYRLGEFKLSYAEMKDGVLSIVFLRNPAEEPKRIAVQVQ